MANTTLRTLSAVAGSAIVDTDLFLVHGFSANTEYKIPMSELRIAVGNVQSGSFTVNSSGVGDALVVKSTDSGATPAPDIVFYRDSANAAIDDNIGNITFRGRNSVAAAKDYVGMTATIKSPTSGSESSILTIATNVAGTYAERMRINEYGNIGIGQAISANNTNVWAYKNITGQINSYGITSSGNVLSDVTASANYFLSNATTANSTFTLSTLRHYWAYQGAFGAASTVTTQIGFGAEANMIGAVNNYGFWATAIPAANVTAGKTAIGFASSLPTATGGGTSWNLYVNGTAPNYFLGNVAIGATTQTEKLTVTGNIKATQQVAGGYTALTAGTVAMALATNTVVKVTPNATATFTTTVAPAGSRATVIIVTSGVTSYTITFGSGFLTTGTLATGTTTAKTFVIDFVSDGTTMIEAGRTTAM
jgi:hypothetical protein